MHRAAFALLLAALHVASEPPVALYIQDDAASIEFGSALDVNLYRKDSSTLKTDDSLEVGGSSVTLSVIKLHREARLMHWPQSNTARLKFGAAADASLYRRQANMLRTDGDFQVQL